MKTQPGKNDGRGLLSKGEAARKLGIGIRALEGLMARKALAFHRISGRCVRFSESEIEAFLERVKVQSPASAKR